MQAQCFQRQAVVFEANLMQEEAKKQKNRVRQQTLLTFCQQLDDTGLTQVVSGLIKALENGPIPLPPHLMVHRLSGSIRCVTASMARDQRNKKDRLLALPKKAGVDLYCEPAPEDSDSAVEDATVLPQGLPRALEGKEIRRCFGVSMFVPISEKDSASWVYAHQQIADRDACKTSEDPLGGIDGFRMVIDRVMTVNSPFAVHVLATPTAEVSVKDINSIAKCENEGGWDTRCWEENDIGGQGKEETEEQEEKEDEAKEEDENERKEEKKEEKEEKKEEGNKERKREEMEGEKYKEEEESRECMAPLELPEIMMPYVEEAVFALGNIIEYSDDASLRFQAALYQYALAQEQYSYSTPHKIAALDGGHLAATLLLAENLRPSWALVSTELQELNEACQAKGSHEGVVAY